MADLFATSENNSGEEGYPMLPGVQNVSKFNILTQDTSPPPVDITNSKYSRDSDEEETGHNYLSSRSWDISRKLKCLLEFLRRSWLIREIVMLLKLAIPLLVMNVFTQLPFFFTLLFVGHFSNKLELAATLLANTFVNITGTTLLMGISTAADTLCPQSYGYKNYKQVGVILQRGLLIMSVACVPVAVVWLNSESLLLLVQQDPCVSSLTGRYSSIFILALPGMLSYFMLSKYLQAQSLVVVFTVIGLASNVCLVIFCAAFIAGLHLGSVGASMALVISNLLNPILLFAYIRWRKLHTQTWGGWSFECLTEWWHFLRLGLPGILALAFGWWSFEISTFVAGSINTTQLTINSTILQLFAIYFMAPIGMAQAVNVRVGNELGAGNVTSAKRASFVALGLQTIFAIVLSMVTISCRNYVGYLFLSNPEVVAGVGDTLVTAIGVMFLDQIQGVISGIMRATGRQAILAVINFCSYYIVGLPLGITMALVLHMEAKGIWLGLSVADFVQSAILIVLLFKTNWTKENEKAVKNASSGRCTEVTSQNVLTPSIFVMVQDASSREDLDDLDSLTENVEMQKINSSVDVGEDTDKPEVALTKFMKSNGRNGILVSVDEHARSEDNHLTTEETILHGEIEELEGDEEKESGVNMILNDTAQLICQTSKEGQGSEKCKEVGLPQTTRKLYNSSTRFCQTKFSIFISKGVVILVCVVLLVIGAVVFVTTQHHPKGCNLSQNCSLACLNSSLEIGSLLEVSSLSKNNSNSLDQPTIISSAVDMVLHSTLQYNDDEVLSDCLCE